MFINTLKLTHQKTKNMFGAHIECDYNTTFRVTHNNIIIQTYNEIIKSTVGSFNMVCLIIMRAQYNNNNNNFSERILCMSAELSSIIYLLYMNNK